MAKRSQRLSVSYNTEEMLISFSVKNAADEVLSTQSFDFNDVHDSLQDQVSLYGLNKLLTDRTSDEKDKVAKLGSMVEVMRRLYEGEWAKERQVGAIVTSPEVEALAQIKEINVSTAQAALGAYDKETRAKILANPQVVELAAQIREARQQQEVPSLTDLV